EDYWSVPGARRATTLYQQRCAEVDPDHAAKRTRRHWPEAPAPDWARP
ncbi:MAG: hypothetical protein QOJ09_1225, partial [Actinomycetota bacterium]|nr:hypothetical protein [Actinomycetota bacterium]